MNTHWDVDSWAGARKDICSEESAAFLNKWKSAECPIIMTGDWNALRSQACIEDFMEATGVQTADDDTEGNASKHTDDKFLEHYAKRIASLYLAKRDTAYDCNRGLSARVSARTHKHRNEEDKNGRERRLKLRENGA